MDIQNNSPLFKKNSFILKWTAILIIITSLSKLLGFAREAVIAYVFGVSIQTDAYFVAILLPGLIFTAFHEAINRAFIPVYGSIRKESDSDLFVNSAGLLLFIFLTGLFILIQFIAPQLARVMAPGFSGEAIGLTAQLMRIVALSLFFNGLSGIISGYLRANHLFLGAALTGLPLNIFIILGALFWGAKYGIISLIYFTVAGYFLALLILIPWLLKTDYRFRSGIDFRNRGVRELRLLLPPLILAGTAGEIKALVDRMFASLLPVGGVSALNYAARVRDLPVSILIVSLATVLFPTLVDLAAEDRIEQFNEKIMQSLRVVIFLMLPVATIFLILSTHIIRFIFERGAFTSSDTYITATILMYFSIGMVGDALNHILNRAYFALKDLHTPMRITLFIAGLNVILNALLIGPFKHAGIALSTSICFLTGSSLSFYYLRKRLKLSGLQALAKISIQALAGSVIMGLLLWLLANAWCESTIPLSFIDQLMRLGILALGGLSLYLVLMWIMKVDEIKFIPELFDFALSKIMFKKDS